MENKKIHLVITYIEKYGEKSSSYYQGEYDFSNCPMRVSFRASRYLGIPLWFDTEQGARDYIEKADSGIEREFYLIQEFTYKRGELADEAKIIFTVKSATLPVLEEGKTERSPGIWAHIRSLFICDKAAAEDYVIRFNEDAAAAFNYRNK